jgi:hypothetical protein
MSITIKIAGIILLFLLMIVSGIWLAKTGKPYDATPFNIHKFLSLIAVVLAGIVAYNLYRAGAFPQLVLLLMIVAAVLFLVLIVSGGLMNTNTTAHQLLQVVHRIASGAALIVSFIVFYMLLKG